MGRAHTVVHAYLTMSLESQRIPASGVISMGTLWDLLFDAASVALE